MKSVAIAEGASIAFYELFGNWYLLKRIMNAHYGAVRDMAYCFGDKYFASTSKGDSIIAIWDMNTYTKKYSFHQSTY